MALICLSLCGETWLSKVESETPTDHLQFESWKHNPHGILVLFALFEGEIWLAHEPDLHFLPAQ